MLLQKIPLQKTPYILYGNKSYNYRSYYYRSYCLGIATVLPLFYYGRFCCHSFIHGVIITSPTATIPLSETSCKDFTTTNSSARGYSHNLPSIILSTKVTTTISASQAPLPGVTPTTYPVTGVIATVFS